MYIGTTQVLEQFLGDTPIKYIWLGTTQVWAYTYDYEISNVKLVYSDGGTYIKCDGSNYAYVQCTLTKKKGTYIEGSWTRNMNITWNSSTIGEYFRTTEDGKIYFDVDKMGTTDLSYHSNPFVTSVATTLNGQSGGTIYIYAEPNTITATTSVGYNIYSGNLDWLYYYNTSIYFYLYCYEDFNTKYKSGKSGVKSESRTWYLYDAAITTGPYIMSGNSGSRVTLTTSTNSNTYPLVKSYRVGYIGVTQEDVDGQWQDPPSSVSPFDFYFDILHKSKNTYTSDVTQALYYGATKLTDDYTIQSSADIIIANDAHTGDIVYEFSQSGGLTITQKHGLIYVTGVDSATDAWFEVTTYVPVEKEEWWMDDPEPEKTIMTYNILGA